MAPVEVKYTCKLCALEYLLKDGRLHGNTFACVACASSERLLRRNVGNCTELQTWSAAEQCQFFRQILQQKKATQNGRLAWNAIRATLVKSLTDQRISSWKAEVRGKELPLSVWLKQGWDEEVVKKQPCTWSEELQVDVYCVPIRETTWAEEFQRMEKQILQHEAAAAQNRAKKGRKAAAKDDESDGNLDLPASADKSEAAGSAADASKDAARKKLLRANLALCNTAAKALGPLQASLAASTTVWEKNAQHHEVIDPRVTETVTKHKDTLEKNAAAARLVVNTHESTREAWQGEGDVQPLPPLPLTAADLKTLLKQHSEVMKAIRSALPKKEAKAKAKATPKAGAGGVPTASPKVAADAKKRAAPAEAGGEAMPKRRSCKGAP